MQMPLNDFLKIFYIAKEIDLYENSFRRRDLVFITNILWRIIIFFLRPYIIYSNQKNVYKNTGGYAYVEIIFGDHRLCRSIYRFLC